MWDGKRRKCECDPGGMEDSREMINPDGKLVLFTSQNDKKQKVYAINCINFKL